MNVFSRCYGIRNANEYLFCAILHLNVDNVILEIPWAFMVSGEIDIFASKAFSLPAKIFGSCLNTFVDMTDRKQ